MYSTRTVANAVRGTAAEGVHPRLLTAKKTLISFLTFLFIVSYEKRAEGRTSCGYHFTVYVSQTVTLYPLNVYRDACHFFPDKTGKILNKRYRETEYSHSLQVVTPQISY